MAPWDDACMQHVPVVEQTPVFRQEDLSKRASEIGQPEHRKRARFLSG